RPGVAGPVGGVVCGALRHPGEAGPLPRPLPAPLAGDPALCALRRPAVPAPAPGAAAVRRRVCAGALRPALPLYSAAPGRLLLRPVPRNTARLLPPAPR